MSIILEQIIRQILLEQRPVASIKQISNKEEALAQTDGAVMAYAVRVKRASDPRAVKDLVLGATLASTGTETDDVTAVGKSSKYAVKVGLNAKYIYVMSDPLPKKNQTILVWILPNMLSAAIDINNKKQQVLDPSQSFSSGEISDRIGFAVLYTVTEYNNKIKKLQQDSKTLKTQIQDIPLIKNLKSVSDLKIDYTNTYQQQEPEDLEQSIDVDPRDVFKPEPDEPIKNKDAEDDDNIVKPEVKVFTYPYKFTNKDGKEFTIYTLNDTDPYVYTFTDNSYWKTVKKEFEASKPNPTSTQVTDEATINKLNTLTGNKVTVNKEQPKPQEKKKEKPEEKKKERTFTQGQTLTIKPKSAFYSWNSATNSFEREGATHEKENTSGKYLGKSKSQAGKYIRVKFKDGEFWVNISSIK